MDDRIETKLSAFRENLNYTYFYEKYPTCFHLNGDEIYPNDINISALGTERIYLTITGAYWWDPATITLQIIEE